MARHSNRSRPQKGVQFPFGLNASNVIIHISKASSGLACNCRCPACKAPLVARKGKKKIWHFAHSSGQSCGLSLISSFANILNDLLNKGSHFYIPPNLFSGRGQGAGHFQFETSQIVAQEEDHAILCAVSSNYPNTILILLTVDQMIHPVPENPEKYPVLRLCLQDALAKVARNPDKQHKYDQEWYNQQLLEHAFRDWQSTGLVFNNIQDRPSNVLPLDLFAPLQPTTLDLFSYTPVQNQSADQDLSDMFFVDEENTIEEISNSPNEKPQNLTLEDLLNSPSFEGEDVLVDDWRMRVITDLLLERAHRVDSTDPLVIGFTDMDIIRFLAQGMFRDPNSLIPKKPSPYLSDEKPSHPRKPKDVIYDYLSWLWDRGLVRSRPGKEINHKSGEIDPRLAVAKGPDWTPTDMLLTIAETLQK